MAYMPPNAEQTTLHIVLQGIEKEVRLLYNPDGSPMQDANGYLYEAFDGQRVTLRFAAQEENVPPPAQPPTQTSASGCDDETLTPLSAVALASPDDEPELWSCRKTKFFLNKYKEMKDFVGKTRVLRYFFLVLFWFRFQEPNEDCDVNVYLQVT
ncbi:uncharacterized protein LOC144119037 [Amblyomma americanum]